MWKRILKYLIGAVTIVSLVIGTQIVTAETGLIVKLPKPITNIASGIGQSFTLGMVGVAYATTPDYICDGVADDVEIQAAMNALPATGGELFFFGGNYVLTATVTRAINNISIVGSGKSTYFANDGGTALFSAGAQTGWVFENFRTDAGYLTVASDTRVIYVDNGSYDVTPTGASTFIVAASNAATNEKAGANWICDGTDDDVQIQAALDALPATGGSVHLTSGTFYMNNPAILDDYQTLSGVGFATTLKLDAAPAVARLISATSKGHVTVRDMTLDGSWKTGTGIYLDSTQYSIFENIRPLSLTYIAQLLVTDGANDVCGHNTFNNFKMDGVNSVINGFLLSGDDAPLKAVTDNFFTNITIWLTSNAVGTGIDFVKASDTNDFSNIYIGMAFAGQTGVVYNSDTPAGAEDVYDNNFHTLIIDMAAAGMASITAGHTGLADGNNIGSTIYNLIIGGTDPAVPTWNANGKVFLAHGVINGKPTEANGIASVTGATNSVNAAHGLPGTPTVWSVTPSQTNSNAFGVASVDATNIDIQFETQPGAGTWYFKWRASYHGQE